MKENIYKCMNITVAEIDAAAHASLMTYWTEEPACHNITLPVEGVYHYLSFTNDNKWDAIYVTEGKEDTHILFGECFNNKNYALKWLAGEYEDTEELLEQDKRNNPTLDKLERSEYLLQRCVSHIVSFEDDMAADVLRSLGFYPSELAHLNKK